MHMRPHRRPPPVRVHHGERHQQEHEVDQVDQGDGADGHRPAPGADRRRCPDGPVVEQDPDRRAGVYTNQLVMALMGWSSPLGAGGEVPERYRASAAARGQEDDPHQRRDLGQRMERLDCRLRTVTGWAHAAQIPSATNSHRPGDCRRPA